MASLNNRVRMWAREFSGLSDDEKRHLMANYSIPLDMYVYVYIGGLLATKKVFRLAHKLGIRGMNTNMALFAADFENFGMRPSANYDLSGRPFSSMDDGTYAVGAPRTPTNPNGLLPADPRVAKVKTFLRRYLTREPTDKDIDWFVYTYFGSDAYDSEYTRGLGDMYYGMQDSYYNARGRKKQRNAGNFNNNPPIRRNQRRIHSGIGYNRNTYLYHGGDRVNGLALNPYSNSNSNSSNSNFRHPTAVAYTRNKPQRRLNQQRNKSKRIQWKENAVNNMPEDHIAGHNFSNGQKAVKYTYGRVSQYLLPQSFRNQARMSMTDAYNKAGSFTMFKNPFTRANLKRSNISFVILKNKNQGRATKLKTQAVKKIQTARRKQVKKRVSTAASKRKRSPK